MVAVIFGNNYTPFWSRVGHIDLRARKNFYLFLSLWSRLCLGNSTRQIKMSDNTWRKLLSYFDKHSSGLLNDTEKTSLKRTLSDYEFDAEMLAMADERDFQAAFTKEWSSKKRKIFASRIHM